jgi:hypothetical protein
MDGTDTSNQQKRRGAASGRPDSRIELLASFGLAATITGIFSAGGDYLKGRQSADEQRCSIAQQFVLDEIPSPALSTAQRSRLNALSVRLMERCMGETK